MDPFSPTRHYATYMYTYIVSVCASIRMCMSDSLWICLRACVSARPYIYVCLCLKANKLSLNVTKTEYMFIGSDHNLTKITNAPL